MSTNSPAPRNENEARIARARAGMANADRLWSQPVSARKGDASATPAPASHLSSIGGVSTMKGAEVRTVRKADDLDALPSSVQGKAKGFDTGQRAILVYVYETNRRTGKPVALDVGEAAKIMGSTPDKAARFISTLETLGLISRSYSSLGPLIGFLPAIGA